MFSDVKGEGLKSDYENKPGPPGQREAVQMEIIWQE
jgi:hypothetical protein